MLHLRRYRLKTVLLFSLSLSAILLFHPIATAILPPPTHISVNFTHNSDNAAPALLALSPNSQVASRLLTENVRKTVLENGLTILTKEVHTAPVVNVQVWYKLGSRHEKSGENGIVHQLEHLLFKGTFDRPIQFGRLFHALGSDSNAFTSYDQTAYYNTVERNKLNALLILEADRMHNSRLTADDLDKEKHVVISELQGDENDPSYRLYHAVMAAMLPDHPYGLPIGGTKTDVETFTVEQVQAYYHHYYSPDNAVLIVVGDFQTEPTLQVIRETFGRVPKQDSTTKPPHQDTQNPLTPIAAAPHKPNASHSHTPVVLREPGSNAIIQVMYPLPDIKHPDVAALKVMDYIMDNGGRSSRLYQALVESGLATSAGSISTHLAAGGWYSFSATAAPNQSLTTLDRVFQELITTLQTNAVSEEELSRAKVQIKASLILGNHDITNQATQLGNDEVVAGDYRYTDRYLDAINQVTAADVQRVANQYFQTISRTVGFFEPTQIEDETKPSTTNFSQTTENFSPGEPVNPEDVAAYLPPITPETQLQPQPLPQEFQLSNGMKVLLFPDTSIPSITLNGYILAGDEFDPKTKAGLASLTAANLMNGTKTQDALTLAKTLDNQAASLEFSASTEGVNISGISLVDDFPVLIKTLTDVLQNAAFPPKQLELSRQQYLTNLKAALDTPEYVAFQTFQQAIYPENHPFHQFPTPETLKAISREDMINFYQTYYRPDATVLTLVGDFDPVQMRSQLETLFASWQPKGQISKPEFPSVQLPETLIRFNQVLPGKAEAITYIGHLGISRLDPRYYVAKVLNQIIGGDTLASRLGTEIRDRLGLTYGVYSGFDAGIQTGSFSIEMQTSPENANRAINTTIALLNQVREQGVTVTEVETAKRAIISNYRVALANPDVLSAVILRNQVYGMPQKELQWFPEKIQAVTFAQVNQVAKELLHPDRVVVVTAGPHK